MRPAIFFFALLALCQVSFATIINVPADQPTIQAGIDTATNGDTVLISDGQYYECINYYGKAIMVGSHYIIDGDTTHINNTIIDGDTAVLGIIDTLSLVSFVNGEESGSILSGLTLRNGIGTFRQVDGNRLGGAINISGASPKIEKCKLIDNSCYAGGGMILHQESSPDINDCYFISNTVPHVGGAVYSYSSSPTFSNCVFARCVASYRGGAIFNDDYSNTIFTNCTFFDNWNYCIFNKNAASLSLTRCIVAFTPAGNGIYGPNNMTCCNIYNSTKDGLEPLMDKTENYSLDPLFCDTANLNLHVASNSVCAPANNSCNQLIGALSVGCDPITKTIIVYPDGSGDAPTIQAAVNLAYNGDTILLMHGVYTGDGNRDIHIFNKELCIFGDSGADSAVIDCEGYPGIIKEQDDLWPELSLAGFVVQNASTGIEAAAPISIKHLRVSQCTTIGVIIEVVAEIRTIA